MTKEALTEALLGMTQTLYRVACTQLRSPSDREDAVQETLCRVWQKRGMLLLGENDPASDPVAEIGQFPDREGQTILEWAQAHQYTSLYRVFLYSAVGMRDAGQDTFDSSFHSKARMEADGSTTILLGGGYHGTDRPYQLHYAVEKWDLEKMQPLRPGIGDGPTVRSWEVLASGDFRFLIDGPEEARAEIEAEYAAPTEYGDGVFRIRTVRVVRTPLARYFECVYTLTEADGTQAARLPALFSIFTVNGQTTYGEMDMQSTMETLGEDGTPEYHYLRPCGLPEPLPDQLRLTGFVASEAEAGDFSLAFNGQCTLRKVR